MNILNDAPEGPIETPPDLLSDPKTLENFLSLLTHDIKAPIRHLRMHLDGLQQANTSAEPYAGQSKINEALLYSNRSLGRLKKIADRLSEYHISLLQPQPEHVTLQDIFEEQCNKLQPLIQRSSAKITIDAPTSVTADREQLGILANNLLENAILYHGTTSPVIHVNMRTGNSNRQLIIEDCGPGIAEKHREQVFKPFTRLHTKDQIEGAGLGLWICRTIAHRHHMTLRLENRETQKVAELSSTEEGSPFNAHGAGTGCRAILGWKQ